MARSTYIYIVRSWPHERWQVPENLGAFTVKREALKKFPPDERGGRRLWRYKDGTPDEGVVIEWDEPELKLERSSGKREGMSIDALRGDNEQAQQILDSLDE